MKVLNVELKMTIPNALSIFRLLLLPVFATLYLMSEKRPELLYWSFGVLVLSGRDRFAGRSHRPPFQPDFRSGQNAGPVGG